MSAFVHTLLVGADTRLVIGWVLVLVLAWSCVAKLLDLEGTAEAIAAFRLGLRPSHALALNVALVEAALSTGLALALTTGFGLQVVAGLVGLVFAFFVLILTRGLASGHEFSCHCFGSHERPISVMTVNRSVVLTALAFVIAFGDTPPASVRTSIEGLVVGMAGLGWVLLGSLATRMLHFNAHLRAIGGR
jgi:hypothetical protein